jgi:neutral ceramidase
MRTGLGEGTVTRTILSTGPFVAILAVVAVLPVCSWSEEPRGPRVPYPTAFDAAAVVQERIDDIGERALVLGNGDLNTLLREDRGAICLRVTKHDPWDARIDTSEDPPLSKMDIANRKWSGGTGTPASWYSTALVLARPEAAPSNGYVDAGVGMVDITPTEPVVLAGSPTRLTSSSISSRLYVRALVLSADGHKVAMVTLDTLKYPVEHVVRARHQIEKATGIPASNVIICASHTHRGPLWSYYKDQLVTPIAEAVTSAARDLTPCRLGTAKGKAEGVSECRRVIKDGKAWNRWQLAPEETDKYPAEGPADPDFDVLAVICKDGKYKAVVYNFACHAANTRDLTVSADYPGDVQQHVQKNLGYQVPTLFLAGACGDVNPVYSVKRELLGERLGAEIMRCLGQLEPIAKPSLSIECRLMQMPGREHPQLQEAEIARNWPQQIEHYRATFNDMKKNARPTYQYFLTGMRIGDDFAIATNPDELFCGIGMNIKRQSPFKHTMVAEQTNGAHGYVPTAKAFAGGSYETWFGEHSYLTTRAGEVIEKESLEILNRLKRAE